MEKSETLIFEWMKAHPNEKQIPEEYTKEKVKNDRLQTPLMLAVHLGNFNYVKQLAPQYVGCVDIDNNCAFNYCFHTTPLNKQITTYLANFENYSYNSK